MKSSNALPTYALLSTLLLAACGQTAAVDLVATTSSSSALLHPYVPLGGNLGFLAVETQNDQDEPSTDDKSDSESEDKVDCAAATHTFQRAYSGLLGMVEWRQTTRLEAFKAGADAATQAVKQGCNGEMQWAKDHEKSCSDLAADIKQGWEGVQKSDEYKKIKFSVEWGVIKKAFLVMQAGHCSWDEAPKDL